MQQLDTQLWVSGSCGCCKRCYKRPGTWNAAGILQAPVWLYFSIKHQSVNMQELESVHNLCSGALPLVVEGQEVFAQQMEVRLQLTLQCEKENHADCDGHRNASHSRQEPLGVLLDHGL